jgi:hypothetical protein
MLSAFPTANAARCPLRFCAQYKSLSWQADYIPIILGTWEAEMRRIGSRSENKKIRKRTT